MSQHAVLDKSIYCHSYSHPTTSASFSAEPAPRRLASLACKFHDRSARSNNLLRYKRHNRQSNQIYRQFGRLGRLGSSKQRVDTNNSKFANNCCIESNEHHTNPIRFDDFLVPPCWLPIPPIPDSNNSRGTCKDRGRYSRSIDRVANSNNLHNILGSIGSSSIRTRVGHD